MAENVGRPGRLDDPEFAQLVAEAYAAGTDRAAMAAMFNVTTRTISRWVHDQRVQVYARASIRERVNRIVRKVDSELEARLAPKIIKGLEVKELIEIRKTLANRDIQSQDEGQLGEHDALNDLLTFMDEHPDLAAQLEAVAADGE